MIRGGCVWLGLVLGSMFLASSPAVWVRAETPDSEPVDNDNKDEETTEEVRSQVIDLNLKLHQAKALEKELEIETAVVEAALLQPDMSKRKLEAKDDLWKSAYPEPSAAPSTWTSVKAMFGRNKAKAEEAWKSARKREGALAEARVRAEEQTGRSVDSPGPAEAWRPLWVPLSLGVLAVGGGAFLTLHESRDRFRWRFRALASRPTALAVAAGLTLAALATAQAADPKAALDRLRDELKAKEEEFARVDKENTKRLGALRTSQAKIREGRALFWLAPTSDTSKPLADEALRAARDLQESFREVRVSARVTDRLRTEAERLDAEYFGNGPRGVEHFRAFVTDYKSTANRERLTKVAACGTLAAAALVPLSVVRRRRRQRLEQESRLCPRCLSPDTLQTIGPATPDQEADDPRQPKTRRVACVACEYETRENYVRQSRLCFPTVGIRESGKTHWLANVYDQIKSKDLALKSVIRKIASRGDERFDVLVKELKYELVRPSPSITVMPEPLTFHVRDADPLGRNRTMVNMFDFSGELTHFTIDGELDPHIFRRRALLCEGFTLFLDPTQVIRSATASIDSQIHCLQHFAEELHSMRGIPSEKPIDLPIAVCISKIDLLVTRNPMATEAVGLVAELRKTLGEPVSLGLIERRSQLIARALPQMFRGWGIERDLRESFGGRFMFFPMSAVGLEESELGNNDLSTRQITPFGMLEPLLWMLHMHGYCVLN